MGGWDGQERVRLYSADKEEPKKDRRTKCSVVEGEGEGDKDST